MDFANILDAVLANLSIIAVWFALFCLTMVSNILAKTFYNVHTAGQHFDPKRFLAGFLKMLVLGVSAGLLGLVASAIPEILRAFPLVEISQELADAVSVVSVVAIFAYGTMKYFKEAMVTIKDAVDGFYFSVDDSEV